MKKIITFTILVVIFTMATPFHYTNAGGGGNLATETTQWINRGFLFSMDKLAADMKFKEEILDVLAWTQAKGAINTMVTDAEKWVSEGLNESGKPQFVTDLKRELLQHADVAANDYYDRLQTTPGSLCEEFQAPVLQALATDYQQSTIHEPTNKCTANLPGTKIENLDALLDGDITAGGGLEAFGELMSNNANTPFGAALETGEGMNLAIADQMRQEDKLLDYGSGFLTVKKSKDGSKDCENGAGKDCEVITHGVSIHSALTDIFGANLSTMLEADEIDEYISSFARDLFKEKLEDMTNGIAIPDFDIRTLSP